MTYSPLALSIIPFCTVLIQKTKYINVPKLKSSLTSMCSLAGSAYEYSDNKDGIQWRTDCSLGHHIPIYPKEFKLAQIGYWDK